MSKKKTKKKKRMHPEDLDRIRQRLKVKVHNELTRELKARGYI